MTRIPHMLLAASFTAALLVVTASAEERDPWRLRAAIESSAGYNSNLTLLSADGPVEPKDAFLTELNGRVSASKTIGAWRIDSQFNGLGNLHTSHTPRDWFYGRGRLGLRRPLAGGTAELTSEARYFTVPQRDTFDFLRNVALLSWRRPLNDRWQVRAGYESILTRYRQSPFFDYTVHGLLAEVRTRWSLGLTTYCLVDVQGYNGEGSPQDAEAEASPQDGQRGMVRVGFDWLFASRHALSGTFSLQQDEADLGVQQIGDIEGPDGSQDNEAEFDLIKRKASLLYTVPLTTRLLFSTYAEWIHKDFDDEERLIQSLPKRTDSLLLSSSHLRFRLDGNLSLKLRYLYRASRSSIDLLEYGNHITSVGIEFRPR
ncbi:MAG: hypothetical protein HOH74_06665 [Gemmatimonadetes bacterium]|jgi:hypothetical protein|nr:hypothetical protein [Gemmatimonadota bacterium]